MWELWGIESLTRHIAYSTACCYTAQVVIYRPVNRSTNITISHKCVSDFVLNFAYFFHKTTVQKRAALCYINLTFAKLTETQTARTNFATAYTDCTKS